MEKKNAAASFLSPVKPSSANSMTGSVNQRIEQRQEYGGMVVVEGVGACKMSEKSKEMRK